MTSPYLPGCQMTAIEQLSLDEETYTVEAGKGSDCDMWGHIPRGPLERQGEVTSCVSLACPLWSVPPHPVSVTQVPQVSVGQPGELMPSLPWIHSEGTGGGRCDP